MVPIPDNIKDLLERPILTIITTLMPDGQPQSTAVWFDYDGQYFRVNTARGRQKDRNMQNNAKVTLFILDPTNNFHFAEIRGHVVDVTEADADAHIDLLSKKYTGNDRYQGRNLNETRVIYKIEADKINAR